MDAIAGITSIAVFVLVLSLSGIVEVSKRVLDIVNSSLATLRDQGIDDKEREKVMQRNSLKLFACFFSILLRSLVLIVITFLPVYLFSYFQLSTIEESIRFLSRWDVILVASLVLIVGFISWQHLKPSTVTAFKVNYSFMDRLLYNLAFSGTSIQMTAADIEKKSFAKQLRQIEINKPIFITSLPRAGTTLMLEVLSRFPTIATHTYRDMPFIMAPLLWSKFSRSFYKSSKLVERAHGDGLEIGFDSPEAFEEILWRNFWNNKYSQDNIAMWGKDEIKQDALYFFKEHMKKIILLRRNGEKGCRYLSKNNANISRLELIKEMFPDAKILVPIRNPIEHANSMHRQHIHFSKMHRQEPFVKQYMADIGHYEFGDLHRPISFPGIEQTIGKLKPSSLDYWLAYWITAYSYLLGQLKLITTISFEDTCDNPQDGISTLCNKLEIPEGGALAKAISLIKLPPAARRKKQDFDQALVSQADEIYQELLTKIIISKAM